MEEISLKPPEDDEPILLGCINGETRWYVGHHYSVPVEPKPDDIEPDHTVGE